MYKTAALEISVKGSNLCRYLIDEKGEALLSQKLFDSVCSLSEKAFLIDSPSLSKNEVASLRKEIFTQWSNVSFYLEAIFMAGYISSAQKESMLQTLNTLKKGLNI